MFFFTKPALEPRIAIAYITVGALVDVWSGIWYAYLYNNSPQTPIAYYLCTGLLLTGLVLIVLGLALGPIGRSARQASETHAVLGPEERAVAVPAIPVAQPAAGNGAPRHSGPAGVVTNTAAAYPS